MAVVLAGGTGTRVGLAIPKQLLKIAGKPIIEHTIAAARRRRRMIDEIMVLMAPGHLDAVRAIVRAGGYAKVTQILEGGETRNATTRRALDALGDGGVQRPASTTPSARCVSQRIIARLRRRARDATRRSTWPSPRPTRSSRSTSTTGDHRSTTCSARTCCAAARPRRLPAVGDPPGVRAGRRRTRTSTATDDCTVVLRYLPDVPIEVVRGDERNMKVTEPIDVYLADKLFQLAATPTPPARPPTTSTARRSTGKTMVVFGGSYGIGGDIAELARELRRHGSPSAGPRPAPTSSAARTSSPRCEPGARGDRPDRLRGQHRRRAARGASSPR